MIHDQVLPKSKIKNEVGGVSAWFFDSKAKIFWALSDDRGRKIPSRVLKFQWKAPFDLTFIESVQFKENVRTTFGRGQVDPEGMIPLENGHFIISSEGDNRPRPRIPPELFEFDSKGILQRRISLPSKFIPEKNQEATHGILNNLGPEGFTISGDLGYLGFENPLLQDRVPDLVRIVEFHRKKNEMQFGREFAYPLEPLTAVPEGSMGIVNGLSEILLEDDGKLLVLERTAAGNLTEIRSWICRLFEVDLKGAVDVQKTETLDAKVVPLKKTLVVDFEKIRDQLKNSKTIDNLEALAWGPKLPSGHKTLYVASDDNFGKNQINQVLVFEVTP